MKRRNKIAAALLFAASIPAVSTWAQNSLRNDVHIYVEVQTVTVFQAVQELAAADASVQECREVTVRQFVQKVGHTDVGL